MPAATTKSDLLSVSEKEFSKLTTLLDSVPPALELRPDPEADETTLKDIVGHRAHWITLFLGWYEAGQRGETPAIPAPGYNWNHLRAFNASVRQAQADLSWRDAREMLNANHTRLMQFISSLDDTALYGAPMPGGGSKWTTGRWAEAAGPSHYRSAAKYIRARLRAFAAETA
ncbi:MAG: ClbS/DfsB family four-helix bundle protein [Pelagimonas sp.]|jgi:hypothetical protein|nr:ClbS/DfsB family four-helix bundle protein [Pelagimonas sp.]